MQSPAAATPTGGVSNPHTTLSDLLADDVRAYFLREGGGSSRVCANHDNVDASRTRRRRRRDGKNDNGGSSRNARNRNSKEVHQLLSAPSQTRFSSSSYSNHDDDGDGGGGGDGNDIRRLRKKGSQSYKSYQHSYYDDGCVREEQLRGQDTAEVDHAASRNPPQNMLRQKQQQQQSFGSGSGSFQSNHRQHDSFGSGSSSVGRSSKRKYLSAADAEFLRRYAEEKERASSRLSYLSPNSVQSNASNTSPLSVQYNDQSPPPSRRPPTVMGSHRPALPSIDNDDWEEDDSIEKGLSDKARKEWEKTKKKEKKKKEDDAKMAATAAIQGNSDRRSRGTFDQHQQPAGVFTPDICTGSDVGARQENQSRAMSPSQLNHHQRRILQNQQRHDSFVPGSNKKKYNSIHEREDSMGTFVRLGGLNPARSMGDGSSYSGSDSVNNSVVSNIHHNSRPLSYLSASSGSGSSGEDTSISSPAALRLQRNRFRGETSAIFDAAAPAIADGVSSSNVGTGYYQNRWVTDYNTSDRNSSTDGSDFNSPLLSYGIMNSPLSGGSESSPSPKHIVRIDTRNQPKSRLQVTAMANVRGEEGGDYLRRRTEKESHQRFVEEMEDRESSSSDESHDTDEGEGSEGSGYATGSGSWDSSSRSRSSHTSSEDTHMHPLFKQISSTGGWKLANFDLVNSLQNSFNNSDTKGRGKGTMPSSERERIHGGPKYSSMGRTDASRESSRISSGGSSNSKARTTAKNDGYCPYPSGKRKKKKTHHQHHRLGGSGWPLRLDDALEVLRIKIRTFFVVMELFISNMPSLVGSLALAWVSLGVDLFKWYEDDACHPTHYHNHECVFPEFPGCFVCDTDNDGYQFALHFHYICSTISFVLCSLLLGKIFIAFPVVRDELANPTTAAPLGLLCMAIEKVFGGNLGSIGMGVVFSASALHTVVACWFIFISVVYKTLPEPSWFPNTTGIGLAAVKVYLYWTGGGYFLSGFALLTFIMFYFVSLFRIHTNEKISVPVCWAQLSGPAVVLYGFTIFSQPGSKEDELALLIPENKEHFIQSHHQYYMPVLHVLFALCMVSMTSSLYLLKARWQSFREKEFSPAHVSFCAPLVSHANALQSYRSSLNAFSSSASGKTFKLLLYRYWTLSLICGTLLVLLMTWKFFVHLPSWCQINVDDDEMPPEPEKTFVTQLLQKGTAGDMMRQDFVSAAVLQANESGALVRVLQDGRMKYVRTRRMPSMGFDPILNVAELNSERDRLLQHVTYAAHPSLNRGGASSFDDTLLDTSNESDRLHATSGRRRLNFLSFDASTMMRGDWYKE